MASQRMFCMAYFRTQVAKWLVNLLEIANTGSFKSRIDDFFKGLDQNVDVNIHIVPGFAWWMVSFTPQCKLRIPGQVCGQ